MGEGILYGVKAGVIAIIFSATIKIARKVLNKYYYWLTAILAFAAINVLDANFPLIIISAAIVGLFFYFKENDNKNISQNSYKPSNEIYKKSIKTFLITVILWSLGFMLILLSREDILSNLSLFLVKLLL